MFYEFTIGLQVAGAIVLLIKYFNNTYKRILEEYFSDGEPAIRDDKDNIVLKKEKIQKSAQIVYTYRISFLFIAFGYFLNVFGEKINDPLTSFFATVVYTIIEILVCWLGALFYAKLRYKKNIIINMRELEQYVQYVRTPITKNEIDQICKF